MKIQFNFIRRKRFEISLVLSFVLGAGSMFAAQTYQKSALEIVQKAQESWETEAIESLPLAESDVVKEKTSPFWEPKQTSEDTVSLNLFDRIPMEPEAPPEITEDIPDQILSDYQNRISSEFDIPPLLFNQTKFWFRVYTEFDSHKKIIHHSLHPHIIFDVVDISDIMAQPARVKWLNTLKAEKMVAKRVFEIRQKLRKMARKDKKDMTEEELAWLEQFSDLKGNTKTMLQVAASSIRIQTGQKDFFQNGLTISTRYLPGMEAIFQAKGLPLELTRLPFVESSFVIGATSKVGAAGIWQFMPGIGRKFMMVNEQIDERRNPWKATEAAAKLLKENHLILHKKWGLALTAYNHGPAGVRRAMQTMGTKDIAKIVRSYRTKNFDFASSNFFTCFLAAMHAQMYHDVLFPDHNYEPALELASVKLPKSMRPSQLMKVTGMSAEQVLMFNPELDRTVKRNQLIPLGYRFFLPSSVKPTLETKVALQLEPTQVPTALTN